MKAAAPQLEIFHIIRCPDGVIIEKNLKWILYCDSAHKRMSAYPAQQRVRKMEKEHAELKHTNKIL